MYNLWIRNSGQPWFIVSSCPKLGLIFIGPNWGQHMRPKNGAALSNPDLGLQIMGPRMGLHKQPGAWNWGCKMWVLYVGRILGLTHMQPQFWTHILKIIICDTCENGYSGSSQVSVVYVSEFWTHILEIIIRIHATTVTLVVLKYVFVSGGPILWLT